MYNYGLASVSVFMKMGTFLDETLEIDMVPLERLDMYLDGCKVGPKEKEWFLWDLPCLLRK